MGTPDKPRPNRPEPHDHGDPDRPFPQPRPPRKGEEPHYTPFLVVRYTAGDSGARPLAPGTVFWESPDVWTLGSMGVNQPVVGEPTQVFCRITNFGLQDATGVTIKYYWADPSVAIVEDPTKLIGMITGATVTANNSVVFQSPADWTPIEVNNGHECLVAEAYVQVFDDLTDPMHPFSDRHVGQKNENLIQIQPSQKFQFHLEALNFTSLEQQVVIEARRGVIPRNLPQRFGRPAMWKTTLLDPMHALSVGIEISSKAIRSTPPLTSRRGRYIESHGSTIAPGCLAPPDAGKSYLSRAGDVHRVTVHGTLPPDAIPGEVHVIRISQRIGEVVVGGYTLYVTMDTGQPR